MHFTGRLARLPQGVQTAIGFSIYLCFVALLGLMFSLAASGS